MSSTRTRSSSRTSRGTRRRRSRGAVGRKRGGGPWASLLHNLVFVVGGGVFVWAWRGLAKLWEMIVIGCWFLLFFGDFKSQ